MVIAVAGEGIEGIRSLIFKKHTVSIVCLH